ncbi:hypothetical protein BDV93DRAFT_470937 [Ceratobasidium sp. AG-I]|nr:hypothetical protein BDV93DRAFT_470937 [Ceratobasidium sp. AG-I]
MAERGAEWSDFSEVRDLVRTLTVEKLKTIFGHIEEELGHKLSKQGNKNTLIERLQKLLDTFYSGKVEESYGTAKGIIRSVRTMGHYQPLNGFRPPAPLPTGTYPASHSTYHPYPGLASSHVARGAYNPYAPSSHGAGASAPLHGGANGAGHAGQGGSRQIRFKPSPFYRVDQPVSVLTTCQENKDATDRRSQSFTFSLDANQAEKLQTQKYEVRLYCTSSTHYVPNTFSSALVPIEFPPTCEIRVNNKNINANVRGLKKKPGTAPPPNLTPYMSTTKGGLCKVELVYVNNVTPFASKKFFMLAQLVEATSVQEVVKGLKAGKQRTKEVILKTMKEAAKIDNDIEAGPQKMSLKCPASYIRINTPCRSSTCVHPQCFDAENWLSMMEQTTTWACPVCDKTLNTDELIVDMYFDDILKCTPDSVEDVIVEADGEWHTEDDKHGSQRWMGSLASRPRPAEKRVKAEPDLQPTRQSSADTNKSKPAEYLVLDSESEDDMPPPRMSIPTSAGPSRPQAQAQGAVIDLTLSSDDEDDEPTHPPPRAALPAEPPRATSVSDLKRKERGTTPQDAAWKRPRVEHPANGFVGGQSDDGRTPTREDSGSVRSNSRPPPPNQLSHPAYSHTTSSSASAGRPDYVAPTYGYSPHHNPAHGMPPANPYGPRFNNNNSYTGVNRYNGYPGSPSYTAEPLPFSSNGRAHPSLPRPHPNSGPGPSNNTNRGEPWF